MPTPIDPTPSWDTLAAGTCLTGEQLRHYAEGNIAADVRLAVESLRRPPQRNTQPAGPTHARRPQQDP